MAIDFLCSLVGAVLAQGTILYAGWVRPLNHTFMISVNEGRGPIRRGRAVRSRLLVRQPAALRWRAWNTGRNPAERPAPA